jgi:hypothetical protein
MRMAIWLTCLFSLLVWLTACNTALSYAGRPIPFTPGLIFEKIDRNQVFSDPAAKALGDAACRGQTKAIEASIASGVDPDVRGLKGLTPMAMALKCESFAGVKALLENGADPNAVFFDGWVVPLSVAPEYDDRRIMEALLAAGAHVHIAGGITAPFEGALHYKRRTGSWERLDLLVQHGLDIDTYRSKSPPGRYSPTYLSNLLSSGEPCKALEYIKQGRRVNEHVVLLKANSGLYFTQSENRCKDEINTILRSRLDPEEVERFPEEFSEAAKARVRALDEN